MGRAGSETHILGNTRKPSTHPGEILALDLDGLPNLLDAKDVMQALNCSRSAAYRLMVEAGAIRYGTAKNHSLRLPKAKLAALIDAWVRQQR